MKIFNNSILLIALIAIAPMSHAKHRVGNGGHSVASHFSTIANNIALVWEDVCLNKKDSNAYCSYLNDYKASLDKDSLKYIKVKAVSESTDTSSEENHPCKIDDSVREACNDGQNLIIVNTTAWRKMQTSASIINLVLHEYFSVLELDSSDHYQYSMKVFSMLKHKGFDLDLLAAHEILPTPCSIKVVEKTRKDNLKSLIIEDLEKKRYSIKDSIETTRYEVNIATKCEGGSFKVSCAVFTELKDTYTQREIFTDMQITSGIRKKAIQLFEVMQRKINKKVEACNM
jgi:hypothetical protein